VDKGGAWTMESLDCDRNRQALQLAPTIERIAKRESLTRPYVIRVIELAFLAPGVAARIRQGDTPYPFRVRDLFALLPMPDARPDQEQRLSTRTFTA
jgi:hypothetical protein